MSINIQGKDKEICGFLNCINNDIFDYFTNFKCSDEFNQIHNEYDGNNLQILDAKHRYEANKDEFFVENICINTHPLKEMCNILSWSYQEYFEKTKHITENYMYEFWDYTIDFEALYHYLKDKSDIDLFIAIVTIALTGDKKFKCIRFLSSTVNRTIRKYNLFEEYEYIKDYNNKCVFVAMSFSENMKAARDNIKNAIVNAGYNAVLIDEQEYNGEIVPEIYNEIEDALFVVADVTEHKNGVYYEAGYAKALKKQIIFCCKKDDFNNTHFDIKQMNHIIWNNEKDLKDKLYKRIINCNFE